MYTHFYMQNKLLTLSYSVHANVPLLKPAFFCLCAPLKETMALNLNFEVTDVTNEKRCIH